VPEGSVFKPFWNNSRTGTIQEQMRAVIIKIIQESEKNFQASMYPYEFRKDCPDIFIILSKERSFDKKKKELSPLDQHMQFYGSWRE
jgi:hypothetical protein